MISSVTELPFCQMLGLQRGDASSQLTLPEGTQYLNHLGTVHAGALLTLAEAASGEFLLSRFGKVEGIVPVVRRLEAKFRKPAHGTITSKIATPQEQLNDVQRDLDAKGRASISIAVDLHDQSSTHVLSAEVEWFIASAS